MKNHLTHKIEPNQHELNRLTHELRTPNEAFFHRNSKLLGLGRQFNLGRYILGHSVYFRPINQHPFLYSESPVHVFN